MRTKQQIEKLINEIIKSDVKEDNPELEMALRYAQLRMLYWVLEKEVKEEDYLKHRKLPHKEMKKK